MARTYYQVLDVSQWATRDEVVSAYRKLARIYHPDVNPKGEARFKEVAQAFEVLEDEKKRREYDEALLLGADLAAFTKMYKGALPTIPDSWPERVAWQIQDWASNLVDRVMDLIDKVLDRVDDVMDHPVLGLGIFVSFLVAVFVGVWFMF